MSALDRFLAACFPGAAEDAAGTGPAFHETAGAGPRHLGKGRPGIPERNWPRGCNDKKQLTVRVVGARDLIAGDSNGLSDPFATLLVGSQKFKTKTINKTLNPDWDETLVFGDVTEPSTETLFVKVMDKDVLSKDDPLGQVEIPLNICEGYEVTRTFALEGVDHGSITLTMSMEDPSAEAIENQVRGYFRMHPEFGKKENKAKDPFYVVVRGDWYVSKRNAQHDPVEYALPAAVLLKLSSEFGHSKDKLRLLHVTMYSKNGRTAPFDRHRVDEDEALEPSALPWDALERVLDMFPDAKAAKIKACEPKSLVKKERKKSKSKSPARKASGEADA